MLNIVFYFQVHQPYRLKRLSIFDINNVDDLFDEELNKYVIQKVSKKCYIPTNELLLKLINKYEGRFKVAFSISGVTIEQFKKYCPETLILFKELAKTGCVEFLNETYYHSLSFLYDEDEFKHQIKMHYNLIREELGWSPIVFRNTELIFYNKISDLLKDYENIKVILTEGTEKVLEWRSPLYPYRTINDKHFLLMKHYALSDDIAFRFSNKGWVEWPLTVDKFVKWVDHLGLIEKKGRNIFLNLFMDYETFGEHQWEDTGIFKFLEKLPSEVFKYKHLGFCWPSDIIDAVNYPVEKIDIPYPISWADTERDLSAWLSNDIQHNAIESFYKIFSLLKNKLNDEELNYIRRLSTSDHFYYMCTKYFQDGDVHKYFSPYETPENAYIYYLNALASIQEKYEIIV
ncbi:MAG: glycoside hydrolase family 57 protein [Spirochaetes bacterium]|nr:glycoside hydrolase family 57 protein [Spirochaetota bacterium]